GAEPAGTVRWRIGSAVIPPSPAERRPPRSHAADSRRASAATKTDHGPVTVTLPTRSAISWMSVTPTLATTSVMHSRTTSVGPPERLTAAVSTISAAALAATSTALVSKTVLLTSSLRSQVTLELVAASPVKEALALRT